MNVLSQYLKDHEFEDEQDELKFRLACVNWTDRAEYFFRDPNDKNKPLRLYEPQKRIINAVQYGIDVEFPDRPPTVGSIIYARRQKMGKSTACAAATAAGLLEGRWSFGLFAHVEDKSFELMRKVQYFISTSPFKKLVKTKSKQILELKNFSSAKTHAASTSIEGGSFHYGIIDEAGLQQDVIIKSSILPCFSKIGKHWVMIGTPKGVRGVFNEFYQQASEDIDRGRHPRFQIIYLDPIKYGLATPEEIEKEIELYGSVLGLQEALGLWISDSDTYFPVEMVNYAMEKTPPHLYHNSWKNFKKNARYSLGIDFGLAKSNTVFAVCHEEGDVVYLDYMETFKNPRGYLEILESLRRRWLPYWLPQWVVPDGTGIGRTNCEIIKSILVDFPTTQIVSSNPKNKEKIGFIMGDPYTKQELFQNLLHFFESKKIALPVSRNSKEIHELKKELAGVQYEMKPKYIQFLSASGSLKTDRVVALALACYVFKKETNTFRYTEPITAFYDYRGRYMEEDLHGYFNLYDEWDRSEQYDEYFK